MRAEEREPSKERQEKSSIEELSIVPRSPRKSDRNIKFGQKSCAHARARARAHARFHQISVENG